MQSFAAGDFSPNFGVVVQFDSLTLANGQVLRMRLRTQHRREHVTLSVAAQGQSDDDAPEGVAGRAREAAGQAKRAALEKARSALSPSRVRAGARRLRGS
jgi:hypothetical protein